MLTTLLAAVTSKVEEVNFAVEVPLLTPELFFNSEVIVAVLLAADTLPDKS
jgi:hypothetical protein